MAVWDKTQKFVSMAMTTFSFLRSSDAVGMKRAQEDYYPDNP